MNCLFFFFQAEDGIRDDLVTGVQTCALPISLLHAFTISHLRASQSRRLVFLIFNHPLPQVVLTRPCVPETFGASRVRGLTAKRSDRELKRPPAHTVLIHGGSLPPHTGVRPRDQAGSNQGEA